MKKVISYSLWGGNPLYTHGAIHNVRLATDIYPDWVCRFYIDTGSVPRDVIEDLESLGAEIVLKDGNIACKGSLWRFEVMFDEDVDVFIVRDADSRLDYREKLAVDEWVESGKAYHVMRDHPHHGPIEHPLFAGMFGGKVQATKEIADEYYVFMNFPQNYGRGCDQNFLRDHVWDCAKDNMLCHDTHRNSPYLTGDEKHFPIDVDEIYHVGAIIPAHDSGERAYADYKSNS